jgi:hypothetical protein
MQFSAFAPFGLSEFSSAEPIAETIYRGINSAIGAGKAFDVTEGTDIEATNFADAIAIACAQTTLTRAKLNIYPETAYEKLPAHEAAFQVSPEVNSTVPERRAILAAKNLASRGSREEALVTGLRTLLGSDFVHLYSVPVADREVWPTTIGGAPGLYSRVDIPAKTLRLLDPIAPDFSVSGSVKVPYENWDTSQADETIAVGEELVIEPEIPGGAEVVTVTASSVESGVRYLTATFTRPHPNDCAATTRQTPIQTSTKRHFLVVLKVAAAQNVENRRKVHELMRSVVRGVSTWSIVHEYIDGYLGFQPYALDTDALDANILTSFFW